MFLTKLLIIFPFSSYKSPRRVDSLLQAKHGCHLYVVYNHLNCSSFAYVYDDAYWSIFY